MILIIYVDIILTTDDIVEMERLKKSLAAEFEIKDLSPLRYFLGMEVARNRSDISISQRKYVLDLLEEIGMLRCKLAETPINHNLKLGKQSENTPVDKSWYQRLIGKLIYLSHTKLILPLQLVSWASICILLMKNTWKFCVRLWDTSKWL